MSESVVTKITNSVDDTMKLGEKLGAALKGGELIELVGDVGAGKTTLVKGIACGAGSNDDVTSPTFVLANTYVGRVQLHHLDLYRLDDAGLIKHEVEEAASLNDGVVVIEWAGMLENVLPKDRIQISLQASGENKREIRISIPERLNYIFEATE